MTTQEQVYCPKCGEQAQIRPLNSAYCAPCMASFRQDWLEVEEREAEQNRPIDNDGRDTDADERALYGTTL